MAKANEGVPMRRKAWMQNYSVRKKLDHLELVVHGKRSMRYVATDKDERAKDWEVC